MHRSFLRISGLLLFGSLGSVFATQPLPAEPSKTAKMATVNPVQELVERYSTDRNTLTSVYADPLAPVTRERLVRFDADWHQRLAGVDFSSLDQEGKADYILFSNLLLRQEHQRSLEAVRWKELESLLPFAQNVFALEASKRKIEHPDGEKIAGQITAMTTAITGKRAELEKTLGKGVSSTDRIHAWQAAADVDILRERLRLWFEFYNGYDPAFTWWVAQPYKHLDETITAYRSFLREKVAGIAPDDKSTVIGVPVGREQLLSLLSDEMIDYTPEELIAMAKQQMAWCQEQMRHASREMGFGDDWHKALEKVKQSYVEPGKQPQLIRDLALEGQDFVEKNNLVTIPELAKETWRMDMMTPERQLENPFFTGGDTISVSYPTDTMTFAQRRMSMRGNNIYFSRATVFHELIPGHWLQQFMTDRYRPYRNIFSTGFWIEGDAFYWETMFWDRGFDATPEQRVGALFWRMHRCARIIFSLSFHLGLMTPEQAVDYLVAEVGHERDNAVAEVRRSVDGSYDPLYQCAYMVGAMQFRALHKELVGGGKMTDKAFNDAVLHENMMPIELLRAILENQPLTPDGKPSWRFLEKLPAPKDY